MRSWPGLAVVGAALWLPGAAAAATPYETCAEASDMVTRTCLLEAMAADPATAEGASCSADVCRVELACEGGDAGERSCAGSGFEVFLDWNEEKGDGFDLYVTEPDGAESWYYLCGSGEPGACARPERVEGTLAEVDLLAFPGGAMLEYSASRATEPPPSSETYRVPAGISAGAFNVRSGPGTVHDVLFIIPAGAGGIVLEGACQPPESGSGADWCPIAWEGQSGWISSRGLEEE